MECISAWPRSSACRTHRVTLSRLSSFASFRCTVRVSGRGRRGGIVSRIRRGRVCDWLHHSRQWRDVHGLTPPGGNFARIRGVFGRVPSYGKAPGRRANEVEHPVELRRAFYMASTETTNAQFRQFEATHDSGLIESYSLDRDHQPVAGISWQQATSFCNWLSRLEGLPPFYRENQGIIIGFNPSSTGYRLPSEAEWEYVARAGTTTAYPWSAGESQCRQANGADRRAKAQNAGWTTVDCDDGETINGAIEKGFNDITVSGTCNENVDFTVWRDSAVDGRNPNGKLLREYVCVEGVWGRCVGKLGGMRTAL